jgi:hypothetical protein
MFISVIAGFLGHPLEIVIHCYFMVHLLEL